MFDSVGNFYFGESLQHHGIKGQHWGDRNGPPYPLDSKKSSAVKKRGKMEADYRKKKKKLQKGDKRVKTNGISKEFSRADRLVKAALGAKNPINGLAAVFDVASELAGQKNPYTDRFSWKQIRELSDDFKRSDLADDIANLKVITEHVNGSRFHSTGYTNNCSKCTAAWELQRRGIDVKAGYSLDGNLDTAMEYWFDGARTYKEKTDNVLNRIKKFGRRGSGSVAIRYLSGGGHIFNFYTNGKDNKTRFIDSQTSQIFDSWEDVKKYFPIDTSKFIKVTRLDDARPNFKHMNEDDVIDYGYGTRGQLSSADSGEDLRKVFFKADSMKKRRTNTGRVEWEGYW